VEDASSGEALFHYQAKVAKSSGEG